MALQLGALRDALEAAGADAAKAAAAAEEVASYEQSSIRSRLGWLTGTTSVMGVAVIAILISQFALWQAMGQVSGQLGQISNQLSHITELLEHSH